MTSRKLLFNVGFLTLVALVVLTLVLIFTISLVQLPAARDVDESTVFSVRDLAPSKSASAGSMWTDYRVLAGLLLGLTALLLVWLSAY